MAFEASGIPELSLWALRQGGNAAALSLLGHRFGGFGSWARFWFKFGGLEALKRPVKPTFWGSWKDPEGRVGCVPEGTELAEMPRQSGVGTEFGAFAEIVVFLYKKQGFGGFGHPRIVAFGLRRSGIVSFGALVRRFWVSGPTLGPLRQQVAR